ncbi:hypothetical protein PR048_032842 [Dryococelus australis]|uniref:Uncharacterized protein n=1 Tax=Dryococelus australis TaxID=614101 RepID=A0ABQ9G3C6_9NEOP|nr:hypothetical protein PR048_032842 [Dryococelus australis]
MKYQKGLLELTPCKRVEEIIHSEPEVLKRKLSQGEVVCEQLSKSIQEMKGPGSERKKNKSLHQVLRWGKKNRHISSLKFLKGGRKKQNSAKIERDITAFFEDDRNSRILPGKKYIIKSESGRQQIRSLEDDTNNLCEKFKKEDPSKRENIIQKMNKDVITVNLLEMGDWLQNYVNVYAAHVGRVIHQHEAVIHMDFSENYCKFAEETQAFHFGGSRKQVSLHTVVTYLHSKNSQLDMPYIIQSFCTLSDCLDYCVHAIWAHLKTILKTLPDSVNTIHFWSDSPSTQTEKKNVHIVITKL